MCTIINMGDSKTIKIDQRLIGGTKSTEKKLKHSCCDTCNTTLLLVVRFVFGYVAIELRITFYCKIHPEVKIVNSVKITLDFGQQFNNLKALKLKHPILISVLQTMY